MMALTAAAPSVTSPTAAAALVFLPADTTTARKQNGVRGDV
jgi:hypothetical protein